jgi:hypothetical protein
VPNDNFRGNFGRIGNPIGHGRPVPFSQFVALIKPTDPQDLADKIMSLALEANPTNPLCGLALRLAAERIWPALKSVEIKRDESLDPGIEDAKSIAARLSAEDLRELKRLSEKLAVPPTVQ